MAFMDVIIVYKKVRVSAFISHYSVDRLYTSFPTILGKSVKCSSTSSGTVRVWPYMEDNPCGPQRSHADTVNHGEKATSEGSNVCAI